MQFFSGKWMAEINENPGIRYLSTSEGFNIGSEHIRDVLQDAFGIKPSLTRMNNRPCPKISFKL